MRLGGTGAGDGGATAGPAGAICVRPAGRGSASAPIRPSAARRVSEASNGAFDVTVGPLVDLWGFGPQARIDAPPPAEAIASARKRVGYRQLELDGQGSRARKLHADLRIDLSALAEGWAVDQVAKLLEAEGRS